MVGPAIKDDHVPLYRIQVIVHFHDGSIEYDVPTSLTWVISVIPTVSHQRIFQQASEFDLIIPGIDHTWSLSS